MQYVDLDENKHTRIACRIVLLLSIVVLVVGRFTNSAAQENYATWNYSANCTLNTSATGGGANVAGGVTNFPVLVRLNAGNFNFGQALASGADIRFATSSDTHLNYSIERFDGGVPDSAEIWVKVPSIAGNDSTQYVKMYWGNSGAVDSSKSGAVFDTANGWSGVWHLNGTGDLRDVTYRGLLDTNHATATGTGNINTSIDMAVGKWLGVPPSLMAGMESDITVSFWNNGNTTGLPKSDDRVEILFTRGTYWNNGFGWLINKDTSTSCYWGDANSEYVTYKFTSTNQWMGRWNHWAFRRNSGNWWMYINGVQVATGAATRPMNGNLVNRYEFGGSDAGGDYSYRGRLDEMRFSRIARSADWVKLEYENQQSNQTLVRISGALTPTISYTPNTIIDTLNVLAPVLTPTLGGGAATSFSISPALQTGLSFNTSTGVITGTPTVLQLATPYTITATNASGSGTATITLSVVVRKPTISYTPTTIIDTQGVATLPITQTLVGTVDSITANPPLPTGLLLNRITGVISGTPTALQPATVHTITATNASGSGTATITLSVLIKRPAIAYPTAVIDTQNVLMTTIVPSLTGGAASSITITPTLPFNLNFNTTNGQISGTPANLQEPTQYIIKAINASDSAKDTITISVVPQRPSIVYPATLSATQNSAIGVVTPTLGLGQPYTFTIAPAQPAGLQFNSTTGVISGTPADTLVATLYIIKATNASDSAKDTITITIFAALAAPAITYPIQAMICTTTVTAPNNTPTNSGGAVQVGGWKIDSLPPAGMSFDAGNGMISGTPTALFTARPYIVTATNAKDSSKATVTISVVPPVLKPSINYSVQVARYTKDSTIVPNVPNNTGNAAIFRIRPALPAGLVLDSVTGIITGIPTILTAAVACTVTAMNAKGFGMDTLSITVVSGVVPPSISYVRRSMVCTTSVADSNIVTNMGGIAAYSIAPTLPAGISFDAATGRISGIPTTVSAAQLYRITAANSGGTGLDSITLSVVALPDRIPPTNITTLTLTSPTYSQIRIGWTTPESNSADADSVYLLYSKTHFPTGIADTGTMRAATSFKSITAGSLSATLNGLSSATRYYFALVIRDTTQTNFSNRITDSITTPIAPDTIAPFINDSILTLNALSATQISVMWNTPESPSADADSVVVLYSNTRIPATPFDTLGGVCRVMGVYPAIDSVEVASHFLSNLSERMMYYVALFVRDAAHNYSTRVAGSVVTRGSNDIINPLVVRGRYADSNHIAIKISNFSGLDITAFPPPYVDSIGVWYNAGSFLSAPNRTSAALIKYPISDMIANNTGGVFSALLPVPVLTSDTVYCISATPFWHQPDSLPLFVAGNGDRVLMRDTIRPVNSLTVAGQYLGGDSVMLTIGNLASLDTSITDSVIIWHGMNDSAVFADTQFTLRLSARAIRQAGTLTYPRMIKDLRFKSLADTAYAVWQLVGRNANRSTTNDTFFAVGNLRPQNPVVLTADVVSASRVKLTWSDPAADSVRLWYGTTGIPKTWDIPASFLSVKQPITVRSDTIEGLQSQTTYFFGIQIYRNGLWSIVTAASSDTVTTPAITDTSRIINTVDITELVFDTATNEIRVRWQVDTTLGEQYVGIQYGIGSYSLSLPTTGLTVRTSAQGTMVIPLREPLRFNTTYYVSIWVQKVDGQWSLPTALSQDTVDIPPFTWQAISYFNRSVSADTVRANNGRIVLFNDPAYDLEVLNDVLDRVPLNSTITGFIPVSTGFKFRTGYASLSFNVGFAYDTALARVYGAGSIRMYRMVLGTLMVEDQTFIDSVAGLVYVRTNKLVDPFIAAIDTVVPTVTILSNDTTINTRGIPILDTIRVSDNIGNVKWRLEAGRGGELLRVVPTIPLNNTTVSGNNGIINTSVQGGYIDDDNGVRIFLITSDGVHTDTINLSRQVIRQIAETYTIPTLKWRPLYTAAMIDNPASDSCLWDLQAAGETSWKFDIKRYRVFRWYETAVNRPLPDKWVELADSNKQHFSFVPGRLMWVKTAAEQSVVMGRGVTMSLRKNYTGIKLPPHSWTDFGLPFRFKIRLSDIMAATGAKADSLEWYGWRAGTDSLYAATPLYVPGHARPELRIASGVTLSFKDSVEGYTVYNRRSDTVTLVVPPIPSVMSRGTGAIAKVKNTPAWCLSVITCNAARQPIGRLECGYLQNRGGSAKVFMLPPSFARVTTAITDEARSGRFGHKIYSQPQDGGYFFDVVFSNTTDETQTIRYTIAGLAQLPPELRATIVRNNTALDPSDTIVITLPANSQQHELLAVGDAGYLAKINNKFRGLEILLGSVFPNPVGRMLTIRYNLPFSGVSAVKFEVYDVAGRIVWSKIVKNGLRAGANTLAWDTKQTTQLARGLYILRMKVVDEQGNSNKVLTNKFTYLGR